MRLDHAPSPGLHEIPREVLRQTIDMIGTLRVRVVRIGLFARLIYSPATDADRAPERIAELGEVLERQVDMLARIHQLLTTGEPLPGMSPVVGDWVVRTVGSADDDLATIGAICRLSATTVKAIKTRANTREALLEQHMLIARGSFAESVVRVCEMLWEDLDSRRLADLERATTAATALAGRLGRLEHIGKHVRLVSLNASVEAARAGENGKGLMVIAQEFKSLAEEIQGLARSAREDMELMSQK